MLRTNVAVGLAIVAALITEFALAHSQNAISVGADAILVSHQEVRAHRIISPTPIRLGGQRAFDYVEVDVVVNGEGNVVSAKLARPSNVIDPEIAQSRLWNYKPFLRDGKPVVVRFTESIPILPEERIPKTHVPFPDIPDPEAVRITLTRTGCYGSCPSYDVEIHGDGSVLYTGNSSVTIRGEHHDRIPEQSVAQLLDMLRSADFFSLDDSYRLNGTDLPTYATSITLGKASKTIVDYAGEQDGMPRAVSDIEDAIDRIADTDKWVSGNAATVQSLKNEQWDFRTPESGAILIRVATDGSPGCIRDLIAAGVALDGRDGEQMTALSRAAYSENDEIVRILVQAGAGRNDLGELTEALAGAAQSGNLGLLRYLIQNGADARGRSTNSKTVLMEAASSGVPQVVEEILKYHPLVNSTDRSGKTAVFYAADWRYEDDVRQADRGTVVRILARSGADLNHQDRDGDTALHDTFELEAVKALVMSGANLNIRNKYGETPLLMTVARDVAEFLVKSGADLTVRTKKGQTIFDIAPHRGWGDLTFLHAQQK